MRREDLIAVRPHRESDIPFIYRSWLHGLHKGNTLARKTDQTKFFIQYRAIIDHILESALVRVACLKDDEDSIAGFAVLDLPDKLHWVYVKRDWRGAGIMRALVPESVTTVTHTTRAFERITHKRNYTLDPFI